MNTFELQELMDELKVAAAASDDATAALGAAQAEAERAEGDARALAQKLLEAAIA